MAPMTRQFAPCGVPGPDAAAYYRRRAGGVGLIITEGTPPDEVGAFGRDVPRFYGDDVVDAWTRIVEGIHAEGACVVPQIWHVGALDPSLIGMAESMNVSRVSPSGLARPDKRVGRPMRQAEIDRTVQAFGTAAARARRIGFDGIELHGAHGYLIDQFFWTKTNVRTDRYGGSIRNRTRFAAEVVQECRRQAGPDFPIILRISQWKQLDYDARLAASPQELASFLEPLVAAGVDIFHCSARRFWEPAFAAGGPSLAAWVRRLSGRPVIAVGSVTMSNDFKSANGKVHAGSCPADLGRVLESLKRGDFDLIAIGRALLANPDWPEKVRSGRAAELRPFTREMLLRLT